MEEVEIIYRHIGRVRIYMANMFSPISILFLYLIKVSDSGRCPKTISIGHNSSSSRELPKKTVLDWGLVSLLLWLSLATTNPHHLMSY